VDQGAPLPNRLSHVGDAIVVVLRRLSALPLSPELELLRAKAEQYLREAESWRRSLPGVEERERLMKRALHLHVEVSRLEGEAASMSRNELGEG
jgi:hypothetical protein